MDPDFEGKDDESTHTVPSVLVEPDVPDPFIVDDGSEDSDSSEHSDSSGNGLTEDDPSPAAEENIALAQSTILENSVNEEVQRPLPSPNINKAVPPPPESLSDEDDEEEPPELYLPGLIIPTMFLPIPNTDPLTTLLTKFIPPERRPTRDLSGQWQRTDFHTLVMTNSWRAIARMARDRIVSANPEDLALILPLWYLRLSALARMRLFNQTSAECINLFTVLNSVQPENARSWLFERLLPFELEVLYAKTKYWAGDHMGYLDALVSLLRRCKQQARQMARKKDQVANGMWKERGSRLCLILASQLIEMKDFIAAAKLLEPLCKQDDEISSPHLQSAVARIYLQAGYIKMAVEHFSAVAQDPTADTSLKTMNAALLASAEGDWEKASQAFKQILQSEPDNFLVLNNLAVTLLSQGQIKEGIQILEDALKSSPSLLTVAEPFLFNLSTLYELRSTTAAEKKRELLIEVAKWAGDGLRTACLKMPTM
ncbi:hypothetical protein BDY19DRAFT_987738 [Irpex rosettiformis]|uniref:Uncharacterized protein n=1 Tax=Irpex rosettiformis TaxID=378272 RepID=A0ACB8TPI8_9APHY|nr:hypothetical protein BDY19DRAFT_987738 [Irpex rosettiformis]